MSWSTQAGPRQAVEHRQRLASVSRHRDATPRLLERLLEGLAEQNLIVGDQDVSGTHGRRDGASGCHQAHLPGEKRLFCP